MKTLGVIGGLGPMASSYYLYLITKMSKAETDQEHMDVLMMSRPSIPDRTQYILGLSDRNPLPEMIDVGIKLKRMGAEVLTIPCITAHYFHKELEEKIEMPIIHGIRETALYLKEAGIEKAGLMATDGTAQTGLFENICSEYGIEIIMPEKEYQDKIMSLIYNQIKTGEKGELNDLVSSGKHLFKRGAQICLLGCTELSLMKRDYKIPSNYLDVLEVLARKAVMECGNFNTKYRELITK